MTKTGSILLSVAERKTGPRSTRRVEFASFESEVIAVSIYANDETDPAAVALLAEDDLVAAAKALCILLGR